MSESLTDSLIAPNYSSFFDASSSQDTKDDIQQNIERLQMRMDELQVVCSSLSKESSTTKETLSLISGEVESLRAVFSLIDRVAVHVDKMDQAVSDMEGLVAVTTKEYNKRVLSNTISPISKFFGVEGAQDMPNFRRPKHFPSFSEDFECDHKGGDHNAGSESNDKNSSSTSEQDINLTEKMNNNNNSNNNK